MTSSNYEGGGDWETILSVQSDLVVYPLSTNGCGGAGTAKTQRQQFIECDLNIKMKRFHFLLGARNKSPLTQLSVDSYARKSQRIDPKCLYSVLTDCCGLYAFCHVVTPEGESDQYWISSQETDPERVVAVLYWLLRYSWSSDTPNLQAWKTAPSTAQDRHKRKATGHGDDHVSHTKSNNAKRPTRSIRSTAAKDKKRADCLRNDEGNRIGFTLDYFEGEDESDDERVDWSQIYALQTQRQAGPKLQFTGDFLQL